MWICTSCHQENLDNSEVCGGCQAPKLISNVYATQNPTVTGGSVVGVLAVICFIIGGILYAGNVTGLFPTFPYAGFVMMLVAGGLIWLAKELD